MGQILHRGAFCLVSFPVNLLKIIYSDKATNVLESSTVDLSYVVTVNYTVDISQNFVAFSEYINFTAIVVNPPERKLAKRTSVQCFDLC